MWEPCTAIGKLFACSAMSPIALIVAHPDDEILALGGQLADFARLSLVHVTDGAPRDPADALRAGLGERSAYARTRALELDRALQAAEAFRARRSALGVPDQEAVEHLCPLTAALEEEIAGAAAVITHPYEGGHPDHDACSFIVQCACERLARAGRAVPWRLEFASYHACRGQWVRGLFWSAADCPETVIALDARRLARKRAALDEFRTQREVIAGFPLSPERLRRAPRYDFKRPPPPGEVLYDLFRWRVTGESWRRCAAAALERLQ